MITSLPEELIAQAESLLRDENEANVRRAVSSAYYALFHLLIRDAVVNWKNADQHGRLARVFDHKRMKDASSAIVKEMERDPEMAKAGGDVERALRFRLARVAETFVGLQEARHRADYDIEAPFEAIDAAVSVAQARLAFATWAEVKNEPLAQLYLYSLLFRDRS